MGNDLATSNVILRRVKLDDCKILLRWRNDEVARGNSFHPRVISSKEHRRWLQESLRDRNRHILIAENPVGERIGVVMFYLEGVNALISINVAPKMRRKGYGTLLVQEGIQKLFEEKGLMTIVARIKKSNLASVKLFVRTGFVEQKSTDPDSLLFHYMVQPVVGTLPFDRVVSVQTPG